MSACAPLITVCYMLTGLRPQLALPSDGRRPTSRRSRHHWCQPARYVCIYALSLSLMTNPDSWSTYSDPSVVRVSTAYELYSPVIVLMYLPNLQRPVFLGIPCTEARGKCRQLDHADNPGPL
jgi:hypothetical protein